MLVCQNLHYQVAVEGPAHICAKADQAAAPKSKAEGAAAEVRAKGQAVLPIR